MSSDADDDGPTGPVSQLVSLGVYSAALVCMLAVRAAVFAVRLVLHPIFTGLALFQHLQSWLLASFLLPLVVVGAASGLVGSAIGIGLSILATNLGVFGARKPHPRRLSFPEHAYRELSPISREAHDSDSSLSSNSLESDIWEDWSGSTTTYTSDDEPQPRVLALANFAPKPVDTQEGYHIYEDADGYVSPQYQLSRRASQAFDTIVEEE